jgi:hypothetical protein
MKRTWRSTLALCLLPLIALMMLVLENSPGERSPRAKARKIASMPVLKKKSVLSAKALKALQSPKIYHNQLRNRIPQSVGESFSKNQSVEITEGFELLTNVAAILKKDYRPEIGTKISETSDCVFFRAEAEHPYIPVAISRATNVLYPLASVVQVRNVTEKVRSDLISEGYRQYYYNQRLKFLTLKAEEGKILSLYRELIGKGLQAQLKVLRPGPVKH